MADTKQVDVEKVWNKVRDKENGDPEYAECSGDFKAKLGAALGAIQSTGISTGIQGLEKFEEEVGKELGKEVRDLNIDAGRVPGTGQPTVRGPGMPPEPEPAEESKESGKAKALKDAAGAGKKVEADEVNSPSFPSARRPLAAEVPGAKPTAKDLAKTKADVKRNR